MMAASTLAAPTRPGATIEGSADRETIADRMIITLASPRAAFRRGDELVVRAPSGEVLDLSIAAERPDGSPSAWYALHPELRHWLGWLEKIDGAHWRLRMEAFHLDVLDELRAEHGWPHDEAEKRPDTPEAQGPSCQAEKSS